MGRRRRWLIRAALLAAVLVAAWLVVPRVWQMDEVRGRVTAGGQPVRDAVVRVKATGFETRTDENGRFELRGFSARFGVHVTAWADGYYIGGAVAHPWKRSVDISLRRYHAGDSPEYAWIPPAVDDRSGVKDFFTRAGLSVAARLSFNRLFLPLSSRLELGCADCHGSTISDQFTGGAHAQGTRNIRFLTMYNGTDVDGNQSPPTRFGESRDYGRFPLPPDPEQPYFGPGFKLDVTDQPGNCAACHMPGEVRGPGDGDINELKAVAVQGVHCDFCHKVIDVRVNPATGLPHENVPGVLSMELRRPDEGDPQMFFGPFDDVDVGPDTYSPLQDESRFCAACHNASFWGTPVYQSYAEWLDSPYPEEGVTCQACHMAPDGVTTNFAPGRGGQERDPDSIFTHRFPGAEDTDLLRDTATLDLTGRKNGDRIAVEVHVTNENAGHHIPTDHPMRNILLVMSATDAAGRELEHLGGQVIPDWGGVGIEPDDYARRPGKGYAKILEEMWTGVSPTAAYWNPTVLLEDTRIPARATDTTRSELRAPAGAGPVTVSAR
ncbi:MAG: carboxypeptidase-like regulatory domain-containing protein, partial [Dehalococcoidia bacterium]